MKLNKIFAFLLGAVLFTACSDDDESWNNGSATVSMGSTEYSFKENKGIVNIPIVVTGEQNGPIRVTVEVAETGSNPAMDDVHYYITSKTIVIPADSQSGNIEMITVDDDDINEERTFTMTIKSVEGATIGSNSSAIIALKDNDSAFYEKLQGKWRMSALDAGEEATWDITILGYDEGEAGYDEILYMTGMMGYNWTSATLQYHYDIATKKGTVTLLFGELFAENVNFGLDTPMDVYTGGLTEAGSLTLNGGIEGTWSDDFSTITFDKVPLELPLFETGTSNFSGYRWTEITNMVLTKAK